jgi:hypothetical protein
VNPYQNLQFQNPGNAFLQAYEGGRERRRESETQNALTRYAINPDDPSAMEGLARFNPQMAIQLQERKRQEAMRGLEAHREKIVMGAKIVRQIQPKDQAGWQQVLATASQLGIDLADVPTTWDERTAQYAQGLVSIADAMEPQKPQSDRFIPLQPGGSLARIGPDGQPQIVFQQNDGSHPIGAQVQQGGPQPGMVEDGYRFKGGDPADPNSWEPVNGGQTPQASGGFPR